MNSETFPRPIKIVAEIGCNHQGSFAIAREMIHEAKRCGCDYVKFQKRNLGSIPTRLAEKPYFGENSFGETYLKHRAALEFSGMEWRDLQYEAEKVGIGFFGTAFDIPSAMFLSNINVPYLKIGSAQTRDLDFLRGIKELRHKPPIILATGMCVEQDVATAIETLDVTILAHTTSSYPCPENEINLHWIMTGIALYRKSILMARKYSVDEIGLSGHYSAGNGAIEAAAVALGATYIERHFTLDRTWKGSDQAASLEPIGMMNVVKAIRQFERAFGDGKKKIMPSEEAVIKKLRGD
jgi:sialic acid synthase SpsE